MPGVSQGAGSIMVSPSRSPKAPIMATSFRSSTRRFLVNLWGYVDAARRTVLNLLFLAIIVAIVVALLRGGAPSLAEKTTLVMALKGPLVEQRGGNVRDNAIAQA